MNRPGLSPAQLLQQAQVLASQGKLVEALLALFSIPEGCPEFTSARRAIEGIKQAQPGAWTQARMHLDFNQLMHLQQQGPASDLAVLADELCRKYPQQPLPHNVLGTAQMALDEPAAAAKSFQRALDIAPEYTDARNNLGAALNQLDRHPEAIECFTQVVQQQPTDHDALLNLGNALLKGHRYQEAVDAYARAEQLRPDLAQAAHSLGQALIKLDRNDLAAEAFTRALSLDAGNIETRLCLGDVQRGLGQLTAAEQSYRNAAEHEPDNAACHYKLGLVLLAEGEQEQARQALERAVELDPGNTEYHHFLNVSRGDTSGRAPAAYIAESFDSYSEKFEQHLVQGLGYRGPELLCAMLDEHFPDFSSRRAVDLGCGSGLCGPAFAGKYNELIGVDLSGKMLEQAALKKCYSELIKDDVVDALKRLAKTPFDLMLCADILIYLGDLGPLFSAAAGAAEPGALFLATTEMSEEGDVEVRASGRYAHSSRYVQKVSDENGFEIVSQKQMPLRKEHEQWLQGGYYLLRYRGLGAESEK